MCADKKIVLCTSQEPLGKVKTINLGRDLEKIDIQHIVTLNCAILVQYFSPWFLKLLRTYISSLRKQNLFPGKFGAL